MSLISRSKPLMIFLYVIPFIISAVTVFHSPLRYKLRKWVLGDQRYVLSTAVADLLSNGGYVKVVKLKTPEGLFLEFYNQELDGSFKKLWKTKLSGNQDGYFQIKGRTVNLAIDDIDNDKILEILAPSFDDNLIAHLNVFHYNKNTSKFEQIRPF